MTRFFNDRQLRGNYDHQKEFLGIFYHYDSHLCIMIHIFEAYSLPSECFYNLFRSFYDQCSLDLKLGKQAVVDKVH